MIRRLALMVALFGTSTAAAECRQALALGLDVSGSVDAREYRLQLGGLAQALATPSVREKMLSDPQAPVMIMVYEWSGAADQAILVPWTAINDDPTIDALVETLRQTTRRASTPGTALGSAMALGAGFLEQQPACWKHTLDISGDGTSNFGPRPRDVRQTLSARTLTINGLVIGTQTANIADVRQTEVAALEAYFRAEVILGPDAFVQTAAGFNDYARAMTEKLLREVDGMVLTKLQPPHRND